MKERDFRNHTGPVRFGFEPEDRYQEAFLGKLMSERTKPGDDDAARSRGRVRVGRHKKNEAKHAAGRITGPLIHPTREDHILEVIMIREILDLISYVNRDENLLALLDNVKELRKIGKIIRETRPDLARLLTA